MKLLVLVLMFVVLGGHANAARPVIELLDSAVSGGTELARNGDFETLTGDSFNEWEPYFAGYEVARGEGRGGGNALRCQASGINTGHGASQKIVLNQTEAVPIKVTCWSKSQSVEGASGTDYSIYLDLECVDGTPMWGQSRAFPTGDNDWNVWQYVIYPTKPIRSLTAFCLFRNKIGTVWFDDVRIEELKGVHGVRMLQDQGVRLAPVAPPKGRTFKVAAKNGLALTMQGASVSALSYGGRKLSTSAHSGFLARDFKRGTGYYNFESEATSGNLVKAKCKELGLEVSAQFTPGPGSIRVKGKLTDLIGEDRAINMMFALPVDASSWTWWSDMRKGELIRPLSAGNLGKEYIKTVDVPCGSTSSASIYPIAAVSGARDGLSIGIDMDKIAIYRVLYNSSTKQLLISYDFGLVPESAKLPKSAEFSFVIYRFEPQWGFRQAWADYAAIYPEYFKVRTKEHGIWMPFGDISTVQGWQDFGFKYHEGTDNVPFDLANDILPFRYSEPTTWWMTMAKGGDRSLKAVMSQLEANESTPGYYSELAKAVKNSVMHDSQGRANYQVQDAPWCDGVVWSLNPCPYNPKEPNGATIVWNSKIKEADYGPNAKNVRAGEYLDSLEGYVTSDLNYRREHFKFSSVPLTFDMIGRPVLFKGLSVYEMTRWMSEDIHGMGKLMFANSVPYRFTYLCPWLDIMGTETNWLWDGKFTPEVDEAMLVRRALSYKKPYLLLMNTRFDDFGVEMVEKYFKRSGFYGILPGMFSHNAATEVYFSTPKWYNRDRALFKKYIPIIKRISEAGWEPVTCARSSAKPVVLERFGKRYITVMNDSDKDQTVRISFESAKLGLPASFGAKDMYTGKSYQIKGKVLNLKLPAGEVLALDLGHK